MRKIASIFFGLVGVVCLALAPTRLSTSAVAEESVVPDYFEDEEWWGDGSNIAFNYSDLYAVEAPFSEMPKTFEAYIQLDPTQTSAGGTIFGNIDSGVRLNDEARYTKAKDANAISFEIDTKGRPKLYEKNDSGDVALATFNVDIRSEEFVHLAITSDGENAHCYVNGEWKETVTFSMDDFIPTYAFAVGNDYREARGYYFKGQIASVSAYASVRTPAEIAQDMTAVDTTDDDLIVSYNLAGKNGAKRIKDRSDNANHLKYTWLFSESIDDEKEYDYAFMALGDTQALNYYRQAQDKNNLTSYDDLFDYIVANAEKQKVAHVFHLGDITQKAGNDEIAPDEFTDTAKNFAKLDEAGISYSVVAGNHDHFNGATDPSNFNAVFGGANAGYAGQYFACSDETRDSVTTTAHKFSAGNLDYLVVVISWNSSQDDIDFADRIISEHPYHNVIIATHGYIDVNGKRIAENSNSGFSNATAIDALVKRHKNVVLTLNGHTPSARVETFVTYGNHGNKITQMVIDPTYFDGEHASTTVPHFSKGAGMIAYLRFSDNGSKVSVSWYSAIKQKYYNSESVYTVEIPTIARQKIEVKVDGDGGEAHADATEITDGKPLSITVMPKTNYQLSKLTVDGEDVTIKVKDNVYTLNSVSQLDKTVSVVAKFQPVRYGITLSSETTQGVVTYLTDQTEFSAGTSVKFTVIPKSGYKVESVTFNGNVLTQTDGYYTLTTGEANDLKITYTKLSVSTTETAPSTTPSTDQTEEPAKSKGITGGIIASVGIALAVTALAGITVVVLKRKNGKEK